MCKLLLQYMYMYAQILNCLFWIEISSLRCPFPTRLVLTGKWRKHYNNLKKFLVRNYHKKPSKSAALKCPTYLFSTSDALRSIYLKVIAKVSALVPEPWLLYKLPVPHPWLKTWYTASYVQSCLVYSSIRISKAIASTDTLASIHVVNGIDNLPKHSCYDARR